MNKKYALPAIAMVAVVMGMSAFAPAMATPSEGAEKHNPKVAICHFDFNDNVWEADKMVNKHALKAHQGHGDLLVPDEISVEDCLAQDPLESPVV